MEKRSIVLYAVTASALWGTSFPITKIALEGASPVLLAFLRYLLTSIREKGSIFIPLIDPEEVTAESASLIALEGEKAGASAIMVGGSTLVSSESLDNIVKSIKESLDREPTVTFHGGHNPEIEITSDTTGHRYMATPGLRYHRPEHQANGMGPL